VANHPPAVSIGLPVYNGEKTLGEALGSLLEQTFGDFELIISDNSSTDGTREICRSFAARDGRIRYVQQPVNRGASWNFNFVLEQARGRHFMWAASDDRWAPTFIEQNIRALSAEPGVVASISKVRLMLGGREVPAHVAGTFPLMADPEQNVRKFLRNPGFNSRMYALYRTSVLRRSMTGEPHVAFDWLVVVRALGFGKYYEVNERLFTRGTSGESSSLLRLVTRYNAGRLNALFPMLPFSRKLLQQPHVPKDLGTYVVLLRWNAAYAVGAILQRALLTTRSLGLKPGTDP
jgi:glycosyltransferase involved in cell wall biosynthesis